MTMKFTSIALAASAGLALAVPTIAEARTMRAVGSSTVYPFAKMAAERVARANPRLGSPIIESTGTGGGFKLFCAGVGERFPDIANASRRMKARKPRNAPATASRTSPKSRSASTASRSPPRVRPRISGITQRDLYLAIAKTPFGKPNRAKTWKDVNAKLPALPIRVYGPPSTSGTRDALGELLMTPPCEANASMAALKKNDEAKFKAMCTAVRTDGAFIEAGENDNLIVQKLVANPGTLGIFGYSFLEENASRVKGVAINGVAPNYATISTFHYPGARPLYIYVKNAHVRAIPAIRAFVAEIHQGKRDRSEGLYARRWPGRRAEWRSRSCQMAARTLSPVKFADLK